jgi:hypothetical protein
MYVVIMKIKYVVGIIIESFVSRRGLQTPADVGETIGGIV